MKLDQIPKKNIYQAPERYFEQLPGKVMARVTADSSERSTFLIFDFWRQPLWRGAFAGLALVITVLFITLFRSGPEPSSASMLAQVSDKEALEFLMASERLDDQDLTNLSQADKDLSHQFIQASREDIIREIEDEDLAEIYVY